MKPTILSGFLLVFVFALNAQTRDSFFVSHDPLPAFLNEKIQQQVDLEQDKDQTKKEKKFIEASAYEIQELMRSGRVIYNDPWSLYLQRIMDRLLEHAPAPVPEIQVFVLQAPEVNAFATRQGFVLVSTGLLAHAKTEAELAFILAHEYVHVKNQHALLAVREEENLTKNKRLSGRTAENQFLKFSRDQELEADNEGFDLYMKSPWARMACLQTMDLLLLSLFPSHNHTLELTDLAPPGLIFPKEFYPDSINSIDFDALENESDDQSTHYNVANRRKNLTKRLLGKTLQEGRSFVMMDSVQFSHMRNRARLEKVKLLLLEPDYLLALDEALGLRKEGFKSASLDRYFLKSVYSLAKLAMRSSLNQVLPTELRNAGSQHVLRHFFENQNKTSAAVWAVRSFLGAEQSGYKALSYLRKDFVWLLEKLQKSKNFKGRKALHVSNDLGSEDQQVLDSLQQLLNNDSLPKWKVTQILRKMEMNPFLYYGWGEFLEHAELKQVWDSVETVVAGSYKKEEEQEEEQEQEISKDAEDAKETEDLSDRKTRDIEREGMVEEAKEMTLRERRRATDLPADYHMVLLNPFYLKINTFSGQPVRYERSEWGAINMQEPIALAAQKKAIKLTVLPQPEEELKAEVLNDMFALQSLVRPLYGDEFVRGLAVDADALRVLKEDYKARYILLAGVYSSVGTGTLNGAYVALAIFFFPLGIPLTLYTWLYDANTLFFTALYDIEEGEFAGGAYDFVPLRDRKDVVEPMLYDMVYRLKF